MIRKLLPLIFFVLLIGFYQLLIQLPYDFFREAVTNGITGDFLELRKLPSHYYHGAPYDFQKMVGVASEEERLWRKLHFGNFIIPFPIKHPSFIVVPIIEREAGQWLFGYKILDYKKHELNSVRFKVPEDFTLNLYEHKIFQLPLFKNRITLEGLNGPWRDMFLKDYDGKEYESPMFGTMWNPFEIPVASMVYDLFILKSRERFFSLDTKGIYYWEDKKLGVTEVVDDETVKDRAKSFRQEEIFYMHNSRVYKVELRTRLEDFAAEKYRQKFLRSFEFKASHPDSSISLYSDYKYLSYEDKLGPTGLTVLYAALSHKSDSRQFVREMIQFLERGHNDRVYLDPLYDYAHERFGSSFSRDMEKLRESQEEKLLRKVEEEKKQAEKEFLKMGDFVEQKESFENKEEKINFYLQKAKDEGVDEDDHSRSVIME